MNVQVRKLIRDEVREGRHAIRASYIANKYELSAPAVQQILSDLAAEGALQTHYLTLCSGPHQNFDPDAEFTSVRKIPTYPVTCHICGDVYTPSPENTEIFFEPTKAFAKEVGR
jgi:hypothetical protein